MRGALKRGIRLPGSASTQAGSQAREECHGGADEDRDPQHRAQGVDAVAAVAPGVRVRRRERLARVSGLPAAHADSAVSGRNAPLAKRLGAALPQAAVAAPSGSKSLSLPDPPRPFLASSTRTGTKMACMTTANQSWLPAKSGWCQAMPAMCGKMRSPLFILAATAVTPLAAISRAASALALSATAVWMMSPASPSPRVKH